MPNSGPNSEDRQRKVADLIGKVESLMGEALKEERLDDVPDDSLGQLFASVLRLYAAKIESGDLIRTFPSGSGVTVIRFGVVPTGANGRKD